MASWSPSSTKKGFWYLNKSLPTSAPTFDAVDLQAGTPNRRAQIPGRHLAGPGRRARKIFFTEMDSAGASAGKHPCHRQDESRKSNHRQNDEPTLYRFHDVRPRPTGGLYGRLRRWTFAYVCH
jgi:hypothetical protein